MDVRRELTLADGQLPTTAGTILAGADAPLSGRVNAIFQNTASAAQTVLLTFRIAGGTARRLVRAVLQENEQLLVTGLPMQMDDTLLGVTTSAGAVDYSISGADRAEPFRVRVLTAEGVWERDALAPFIGPAE